MPIREIAKIARRIGLSSNPPEKERSWIQPGNPQQNAYVERFNRTVRHEWLDQHLFESIDYARKTATEWLWRYNNERPNMANGGITPIQKLKQAA
jgi:putative transposase